MSTSRIVEKFESAQNALVLQASDLSLETIAQMVDSKAIDTAPKYQRRDRWPVEKQAQLIESFLLNVPIPPVYLAEDDFGTYSVIDGKQRITTIHRFMRGEFLLENLEKFKEVNGNGFEQLPRPLQNALSIRPYVRVVTLLKQSDPELKYEVFTRLNKGGEPLLPQEIRNALYRGPLNDMLFELGKNSFLRQQLKIQKNTETPYKEMQDVESVLRFLCLSEEWSNFSGDMRQSLDDFASVNQRPSRAKLASFKSAFEAAMQRCEALWGKNAFRRLERGNYRDQFMVAMYDAQMIAASELTDQQFVKISKRKKLLERNFEQLFEDATFVDSVRVSTNGPSKVAYRIQKMKELLAG